MEDGFFSTLEKARTQVNECTAGVLEFVKDEKLKKNYLDQMEKLLVSMVQCEHKVAVTRQAVREATDRACEGDVILSSITDFDEGVEESIHELELDSPLEQALAKAPSLKVFNQQKNAKNAATNEEDGEELVATQVDTCFIDPISKKKMTNPVRNKYCRHVYDRASVTSMISKKMRHGFKCPALGCNNRKVITLSDLEDAPDIKSQLDLV